MRFLNTRSVAIILAMELVCFGSLAASESTDPHAGHHKMMAAPDVRINRTTYQVPNIDLVDESGQAANLLDILANDRPLAINFIFTTCTTICPVMTATMLQLQKQLENDEVRPDYISISIDPDYDTAAIMKEYAASYGADWTFLTGSPADVTTTLQAFDAYRGSKVNHFALTLFRAESDNEWTRVEGLTSAKELARIWREAQL
jgi:protein SCO1/2